MAAHDGFATAAAGSQPAAAAAAYPAGWICAGWNDAAASQYGDAMAIAAAAAAAAGGRF